MFRKILVPVDGSTSSNQGLDEAINLARESHGEIVLLHVLESIPMGMEMATADTWRAVLDSLRNQGQAVLEAARQRTAAQGVAVTLHLEEFPALRVADVILKVAQDSRCDLIAMGTHGRRGFSHLMLGSDAERVVRGSPGPVLLVRQRSSIPE